jgi:2-hydroxychromene-2-carboxylate isomerase
MAATIDAYYDFRSPYAYFANYVRRTAAFYGAPLRAPKPARQNSIPALCTAALLDSEGHDGFRNAVFDALWQEQRDIGDPGVLATCLVRAGRDPGLVDLALLPDARTAMADATKLAFANGVFGVPTFVCNDEVFFGNDRLDMLQWRLGRERDRVT